MNKALFFDFDGVLVDSFEISYSSNLAANKIKGLKRYRKLFEGNIYDGLKAAKTPMLAAKNDFFSFYGPRLMKLKLVDGAAGGLRELSKEYKLLIVSSTQSRLIKTFFKRHGIIKYFTEILGSDVHTSKVKKIKYALKKYGLPPQNCLFVTDTLGDILEAKKCGVKSVAVTGGFHFASTLRRGKPLKIVTGFGPLHSEIKNYFKKLRSNEVSTRKK